MASRRIKSKNKKGSRIDLLSLVPKAATGLHGSPLGFGQFIRNLPNQVLQEIPNEDTPTLLMLVMGHAKLIVDGDPTTGVEESFFTKGDAAHRIRFMLCGEHLRRIGMLRVRYPRDPFTEIPETAWWRGHPFCEVLRRLPDADREKLEKHIMQTGDLEILNGHVLLLPEKELAELGDRLEQIEKNLPEVLKWIEGEFADSRKLAYAHPGEMGPGSE